MKLETWEKTEFITVGRRDKWNRPQVWDWFGYLCAAMKEREASLAMRA
ncbi:MAG: hypothetical protein HY296_02545 [Thaumarchaeota archaeon]|nr:hypothetical protein [Nitrososphaerota archaeon]